jgi:hypothetical protein
LSGCQVVCLYINANMKVEKLSKLDVDKQLEVLMTWVTEQLEKGDVPKFNDVIDYAHRILKFTNLKRFQITKKLRLHPGYLMNSSQARNKNRGGKSRPIVVNDLGHLHGDIGFFSVTEDYPTPINYRSGFLVCKDILSRYTYVSVLKKTRTADSMIKAFTEIFEKFKIQTKGLKVKSLAFDKERSVTSTAVQSFLKDDSITFHPFENTSSKSKFAENSIRQIRNTIKRLKGNVKDKEIRWWRLIQRAVGALNKRPIQIKGRYLKLPLGNFDHPYYTPADVSSSNLSDFIGKIQKAASPYYFTQFGISTRGVKFKYQVGEFVRPKLIVISSEVIGNKRSEVSLSSETFIVEKQDLYVSNAHTIERLYLTKSVTTGKEEEFYEDEIAQTVSPFQAEGQF